MRAHPTDLTLLVVHASPELTPPDPTHPTPPARTAHSPTNPRADWAKVTAVADYSWGFANETLCTAHQHGVRVLAFNQLAMSPLFSPKFYSHTNETAMDAWIKHATTFVFDRGMDGIMLDIEGAKGVTTEDFQRFGCKLRAALHALIPGAALTWSVDLYGDNEAAQAGVAKSDCAADWLTLMSYEAQLSDIGKVGKFSVNRSAQAHVPLCQAKPEKCSPMYASAQSSPAALAEGVRQVRNVD